VHSWPPCTEESRSETFLAETIVIIFYKTICLSEEANCIKPSTSERVLCKHYKSVIHRKVANFVVS
jgi:hypothetical protein